MSTTPAALFRHVEITSHFTESPAALRIQIGHDAFDTCVERNHHAHDSDTDTGYDDSDMPQEGHSPATIRRDQTFDHVWQESMNQTSQERTYQELSNSAEHIEEPLSEKLRFDLSRDMCRVYEGNSNEAREMTESTLPGRHTTIEDETWKSFVFGKDDDEP